jgi:putative ABC transport system ATP-binding protein
MPQELSPPRNPVQTPLASTDIEATMALQEDANQGEPYDPLIEAIQKELGEHLGPSEMGLPMPMGMGEALEPQEGEVFRCLNLTKAYGQGVSYIEVIKGISFSVKRGEYIVIFGPSGSGKSTLLHMLSGLEPPSRGEIRIRNHAIQQFTDDEMAIYHREEVGLVFQNFNLLNSLMVWENVAFPLMLAGAPMEWRKHESLKLLDRFGMVEFAHHYPNQLSGGQQQRVALARALIHDPDLLLIDEPTGNLDSKSAQVVMQEIDRLHKQENRTIILVTHSQEFIPYATRVFYIRDGTLRTTGEHQGEEEQDEEETPHIESAPVSAPTPQPVQPTSQPVKPTATAPVEFPSLIQAQDRMAPNAPSSFSAQPPAPSSSEASSKTPAPASPALAVKPKTKHSVKTKAKAKKKVVHE